MQLCSQAEKQHSFWHFACQGFPKPCVCERERKRNNFVTQTIPCFETFLSAVLTGMHATLKKKLLVPVHQSVKCQSIFLFLYKFVCLSNKLKVKPNSCDVIWSLKNSHAKTTVDARQRLQRPPLSSLSLILFSLYKNQCLLLHLYPFLSYFVSLQNSCKLNFTDNRPENERPLL